ncbi:hypothetical protein IT575_12130 [bacterium]|nr:hypothetical protein [bacterium]
MSKLTERARLELKNRDPRKAEAYDEWLKTDRVASARKLAARLLAAGLGWAVSKTTMALWLSEFRALESEIEPK